MPVPVAIGACPKHDPPAPIQLMPVPNSQFEPEPVPNPIDACPQSDPKSPNRLVCVPLSKGAKMLAGGRRLAAQLRNAMPNTHDAPKGIADFCVTPSGHRLIM